MAKMCINHKDQPSVTMCAQCHKPLCKSCVMVTPGGSFCSTECSILNREFKAKMQGAGGGKKMGFFGKFIIFLILVAVVLVGIHVAALNGVDAVKQIDVIGKLLNK